MPATSPRPSPKTARSGAGLLGPEPVAERRGGSLLTGNIPAEAASHPTGTARLRTGARPQGTRVDTPVPLRPHALRPGESSPRPSGPDSAETATAIERTALDVAVPRLAAIAGGSGAGWPLQFITPGFESLSSQEPQAIGLTYWFDAAPSGDPYPVTVRFIGVRLDVKGNRGPKDTFQELATMPHVQPGSGRVALTHRVLDKTPGRWQVTAHAIAGAPEDGGAARTQPVPLASATNVGVSSYAPITQLRAPGVVLGAWPALVGTGVLAALIMESVLAAGRGLPVTRVLLVALVACLMGFLGAKVYYRVTHLEEKRRLLSVGMSIQGFVLAAIGTFALGAALSGIPVGVLLDLTVPSLLLGQAIGRLGCFFGGCCAGLPTASRWGLWSSDRQIGVRRIPVQLMESTLAAVLASATLVAVLVGRPHVDGAVFLAGFALYVVGRQLLFPLRGLPRKTAHGRQITLVLAAITFLLAVGAGLLA
ncbi:prolipoprotein diacylglyceryl transferase [mine drainage metagenome]|uniref:Prolipoprotein diacylglyceryl transferase n=1 Tax=mine drainage metagenome TaxID=410659 RepID=A0A1J5QQZ9_9ZZZZ